MMAGMKRRRLSAACTAGSLLLCLGTCVLWLRSYAVGYTVALADRPPPFQIDADGDGIADEASVWRISSARGSVALSHANEWVFGSYWRQHWRGRDGIREFYAPGRLSFARLSPPPHLLTRHHIPANARPLGFGLRRPPKPPKPGAPTGWDAVFPDDPFGNPRFCLALPHWLFAVLFAARPALRARAALKRRRRTRTGRCPA